MRLISSMLGQRGASPAEKEDDLPQIGLAPMRSVPALEDIYRLQAPRLQRFFGKRAQRDEANDLVQESFARFANAAAEPDRRIEQPEAYLNRIATNLLRNRARIALQRSLAQHVPLDEERLPAADPIAALEARDLLNRLQASLLRLRPKTREIFLAHRVEGMSYNEIASRTGLGVKGVEWHMTKAIAHIDRALRHR